MESPEPPPPEHRGACSGRGAWGRGRDGPEDSYMCAWEPRSCVGANMGGEERRVWRAGEEAGLGGWQRLWASP